jgi:hypothetical protein
VIAGREPCRHAMLRRDFRSRSSAIRKSIPETQSAHRHGQWARVFHHWNFPLMLRRGLVIRTAAGAALQLRLLQVGQHGGRDVGARGPVTAALRCLGGAGIEHGRVRFHRTAGPQESWRSSSAG